MGASTSCHEHILKNNKCIDELQNTKRQLSNCKNISKTTQNTASSLNQNTASSLNQNTASSLNQIYTDSLNSKKTMNSIEAQPLYNPYCGKFVKNKHVPNGAVFNILDCSTGILQREYNVHKPNTCVKPYKYMNDVMLIPVQAYKPGDIKAGSVYNLKMNGC